MIGHSDNQPILWIVDTIEIQKVLDFSFIQRYFPSRNQENPRKEIRFTFFSKVLNHALGTFQKSASSNFYCVLKKTKQSCKNFWGNWDTSYFWLVTVLKYMAFKNIEAIPEYLGSYDYSSLFNKSLFQVGYQKFTLQATLNCHFY